MPCRRLRWRRRFSRTRRLRLRKTNADKSNESDESRNLCNHGASVRRRRNYSQYNSGVIWSGCGPERDFRRRPLSVMHACATICRMLDMTLGCLKWAAVGFVVAFALMKLFEASHIHDDIPKPAFKIRQTKRATLVLSTFAGMLSALVWLLVQKLD